MSKTDLTQFDYKKVAKLDANAWRSYYNHRFFKMFIQLLRGMKAQIRLNWYLTLKLAFYSGRAATTYRRTKDHENYEKVLKDLTKYYQVLSSHCTLPFDYKEAAKLELEWWDIHRYPEKYKKSLEISLAEAAAVVYGVNPKNLKDYAHYRAVAMMIPNHTGDKGKTDSDKDYKEIESLLAKSWQSLYNTVQE
jgi:hypothetical protein